MSSQSEIISRVPINPDCAKIIAEKILEGSMCGGDRDIAVMLDEDDGNIKIIGIYPVVPDEYLYGCGDSALQNKAPDKVYFIMVSSVCPESPDMYVRGWFIKRDFSSQAPRAFIFNPVTMNQSLSEIVVWRFVIDETNKPRKKPEEKFSEPW